MRPRRSAPALIKYRLWRVGTYPVLADSEPDQKVRVGLKTIRYYLFINTIEDLNCDVFREIVTTCNLAVTNCHEIYSRQFHNKVIPKSPSNFDKENPDIHGLSSFLWNQDFFKAVGNLAPHHRAWIRKKPLSLGIVMVLMMGSPLLVKGCVERSVVVCG